MLLNTYSYTYKVRTLLSVGIEQFIFRFLYAPFVHKRLNNLSCSKDISKFIITQRTEGRREVIFYMYM